MGGDQDPEAPRGEPERARLEESVGWTITGNLLATVLLGGGVGYGLDLLLGTRFVVGVGMVVGMGLTLYYLWLRYGTH